VVLDNGERRTIEAHAYAAVDHGYAVTIHKSQGATVDRAFVLASGGMDRHLTYVAMTRHREQVTLYAGRDDFETYKAMAWRLARKRTNETTLDFAERRGIDTVRDWIANGRALLHRARDRFEQAAERIGERLGLGRSLRKELRERQQGKQAPTPPERPQERPEKAPERQSPAGIEAVPAGAGAASGDAARWTAAIEAEAKAVRAKAQRAADLAEKRKVAISEKQEAHKQAKPKEPGRFSLPRTQKRYDAEIGMWTKERDRLERALNTTQRRGAFASELTKERVLADHLSTAEKRAEQRIERRQPALAKIVRDEQERQEKERRAEIKKRFQKQQERERSQERGGRGR
jgi:hypothetical protein